MNETFINLLVVNSLLLILLLDFAQAQRMKHGIVKIGLTTLTFTSFALVGVLGIRDADWEMILLSGGLLTMAVVIVVYNRSKQGKQT